MLKLLCVGATLALLAAAPASATEYLFTIGGGSTATGTLTVQDPIVALGGSLITAITGTYNGQATTGLVAPGGFSGNNNLLFVGQTPLLNANGFAFSGAFGDRNIYWSGLIYRDLRIGDVSFAIREVAPGVPEPASWAMMLIGFGAMGVALRRRRTAMPAMA